MKKLKHTPGPWAWQKFGNCYLLTAQHGMREIIIGANSIHREDGPIECAPVMNSERGVLEPIKPFHPNSKLIAASPKILEALLFYDTKPKHPTHIDSTFELKSKYDKAYKIWKKKFDELRISAIKKVTE